MLTGCAAAGGTASDGPSGPSPSPPAATASSAAPASPDTTPAGGASAPADPGPGGGSVPVPAGGPRPVDPAAVPVRLQVPAAGIDVPLIDLGVAADGTLQVPVDYQQVGWFDGGPPPGDVGPAVIAGHVDSRSGPAPFFRLRDLAPGDEVTVTRTDGRLVVLHVDGVEQYAKDAFPTATVYGPVPGPALRLVTCGGSFDRSSGHYRDNVVVYAS
ncbi:class F sortase [Kineosporiaceae bacterium B12]|nr:class F sortase [Kineococcus rubinsiae]